MKRSLITIAMILLAAGLFNSCKQCVTCRIERLNGTIEAEYEEYCGTESDIDDFKAALKTKSDQFVGPSGKVICTDN
jgi:hypothetical protein